MINLRYHIVSLVAVFLALAIGIVVGSTVLKEGTVAVLRTTSNGLIKESEQRRAENKLLDERVRAYEAFGTAVLPALARDRLKGRSAVLLDTDRVDDATRKAVEDALKAAGADVDGRITFASDRLGLAAEGDRTALNALLETDQADPVSLRRSLADRLADRLANPARLPRGANRTRDVLTGLDDAKFLADLRLADPTMRDGTVPFPRTGSMFVVIGPTDNPTPLDPLTFLVPLADRLSARSATPVVGVEAAAPDGTSWVEKLRAARDVPDRVSTVDAVDQVYGQVALVEALQRRWQNEPTGHYGTKARVTGLLPESAQK
ncbi:MAG TPA: copper transporter [Actinomycetes bacterium]|nr:copper transporter [Actinomycetes bacterium]